MNVQRSWLGFWLQLLLVTGLTVAVFRSARAFGFDNSVWFVLALLSLFIFAFLRGAISQRRDREAGRSRPPLRFGDVLVFSLSGVTLWHRTGVCV